MQYIKHREFSSSEKDHLESLSFTAAGNASRGAYNTRIRLRNKMCDINRHNFIVDLKNLCIDLSKREYKQGAVENLASNLNIYKHLVDDIDYSLKYTGVVHASGVLGTFIQNYLPLKYLKMYRNNQYIITKKEDK